MVHRLYPFQGILPKRTVEKLCPVICWNDDLTILSADQLGMSDSGRILDNPRYVIKASNFGATESLLKQSEAPVRGKLSVPHHHEGQGNLLVQPCHHPPGQVLHDVAVLILAAAVIRMQVKSCFTYVVCAQEVMQHADHAISPFATVDRLINKIVHLSKRKKKLLVHQ